MKRARPEESVVALDRIIGAKNARLRKEEKSPTPRADLALQRFSFVNARDHNSDALISACANGHIDIVKMLLDDGEVDSRAQDGEALIGACFGGHIEIVDLLMCHRNAGVDLKAQNYSALFEAIVTGRAVIVW